MWRFCLKTPVSLLPHNVLLHKPVWRLLNLMAPELGTGYQPLSFLAQCLAVVCAPPSAGSSITGNDVIRRLSSCKLLSLCRADNKRFWHKDFFKSTRLVSQMMPWIDSRSHTSNISRGGRGSSSHSHSNNSSLSGTVTNWCLEVAAGERPQHLPLKPMLFRGREDLAGCPGTLPVWLLAVFLECLDARPVLLTYPASQRALFLLSYADTCKKPEFLFARHPFHLCRTSDCRELLLV